MRVKNTKAVRRARATIVARIEGDIARGMYRDDGAVGPFAEYMRTTIVRERVFAFAQANGSRAVRGGQ